MTAGLVAHDTRKKLVQNSYIVYGGTLSKNTLYAIGTTGRLIEEVVSLNIHKYFAGHLGGIQQMAAQIEHNEMDLVVLSRDPNNPKLHEPDVSNMVCLCDTYNISLATNLASVELLIEIPDRGDMEWRGIIR